MAVRPVVRIGDPKLLQVSAPIKEFDTPELHALITDMFDTMHATDGIGIAAPQIGVNQRIIIFGLEPDPRRPDSEVVPTTVLINPELSILNDERCENWEACLSVPGMRGLVPRYLHLAYKGYDAKGNIIEREAHGFHAIMVQHETDHLDGILYPQRIENMQMFGFEEELRETIIAFYTQQK